MRWDFQQILPAHIIWDPVKVLERLLVFNFQLGNQFRCRGENSLRICYSLYSLYIKTVFAPFPRVQISHRGFYKWKKER